MKDLRGRQSRSSGSSPAEGLRAAARRMRRRAARAASELRLWWTQPYAPIEWLGGEERVEARSAAFDAARAFELLRAQCSQGPRVPGSPGHAAVRELILDELRGSVDGVAVQAWEQRIVRGAGAGERFVMANLFGVLRGQEEADLPLQQVRPALMLCAHWDTRPVSDRDPDPARRGEPVTGANDGASGVAVLLELARVLGAQRPPRSVVFAFWDGEDLGEYCNGSRLFARQVRRRDFACWYPREAILLDMIGGRGMRCTSEVVSATRAPRLWGGLLAAADDLGLSHYVRGPTRALLDDHVMLNRAGIPAAVLIDFEYPYRHTSGDTVERCAPESLAAVGAIVLRYLGHPAAARAAAAAAGAREVGPC